MKRQEKQRLKAEKRAQRKFVKQAEAEAAAQQPDTALQSQAAPVFSDEHPSGAE